MARKRETSLPTGFGFGPPRSASRRTAPKPDGEVGDGRGALGIGEVAARFAVSLRTLRYYEQKGLLSPRRVGATRLYDAKDLSRLSVILKGKTLGFSLQEIQAMLDDLDPKSHPALPLSAEQVAEQIEHLERQKTEIEAALARLRDYRP